MYDRIIMGTNYAYKTIQSLVQTLNFSSEECVYGILPVNKLNFSQFY